MKIKNIRLDRFIKRFTWASLILMVLFVMTGCHDHDGGGNPPKIGTVSGKVISAISGDPIAGATLIAPGATPVISETDGTYTLNIEASERVVIQVEAAGFAGNVRITAVLDGQSDQLNIQLLPIGVAEVVDVATGGTVSVPNSNAQVILPANGLVPLGGGTASGSVNVALTAINPAIDVDVMPGDYTAMLSGESAPVAIESFGALRVDVRDDNGERYTLAAGQTATVRIPVGSLSDAPPATIPLLLFNESSGLWVEEGIATLAGSAPDQFYTGTVQRFGSWNADKRLLRVLVSGCVRDTANQPVANVRVKSNGINYSGSASTLTDADGNFSVAMRRDGLATLSISFIGQDGDPVITTINVGPFTEDTALADCIITEPVPLQIISRSLPSGRVGTAYSARVAAANGTLPYAWSVISGDLPTGLTLDSVTGQISGTPTTAGSFNGTIQIEDNSTPAQTAETSFFIFVTEPVPFGIATRSLPAGLVGNAYNATVFAINGTTPYTWSVISGDLPTGLTLNGVTGQITGTPTTSGSFPFTIQAEDSATPLRTATASLSLFISPGTGPTPPPAPTGLSAFSGDTQVSVTWNDVADADTYNVYMASVSGVNKDNYSTLAGGAVFTSVTRPFVKTGLINETTYYFVVTAVNPIGESVESLQVSVTPTDNIITPTDASRISTAFHYSCARLENGTIQCWGWNSSGQLGNGSNTSSFTPVQVTGITTATTVSGEYLSTCARLENGTVQCWGYNLWGQLGNGSNTASFTPVQVTGITTATAVSAGVYNSCAVLSNGTVQCWGLNLWGQLGNGSNTASFTPVQVTGITTATAVSVGTGHSCALLENGTIQCWGISISGQLGNGNNTSTSNTPVQVTGITTATTISAGNSLSCATLENGTIQCWGLGTSGQLGNGSNTSSNTPVQVSGVTTATTVSASGLGNHICARLENGTIQCWGLGTSGQLGNGSNTPSNTPVQVSGITTATTVSSGFVHSCAEISNGTVQCWGNNLLGQLGDGSNTASNIPVQVTGLP